MTTQNYRVWKDEEVHLSWAEGGKDISRTTTVSWDSSKTKITGARLYLEARNSAGNMRCLIYMEGNQLADFTWGVFEVSTKNKTTDVSAFLQNGDNRFRVEISKHPIWNWNEVSIFVTVSLSVEFTGEAPEVRKPVIPSEWVIPIAIGLGTVSAGVGMVSLARRGEKK